MCVFFFKQKTAYEIRISDWSSDVCSSDLIKPERLDQSDHVTCMVLVPITMERSARISVPPGIRYQHIVFMLECAGKGRPACAVPGTSMKQNQWGLGASGSRVVDFAAVCLSYSCRPTRNWTHRKSTRMNSAP